MYISTIVVYSVKLEVKILENPKLIKKDEDLQTKKDKQV